MYQRGGPPGSGMGVAGGRAVYNGPMVPPPEVEHLQWDSELMGFRVGRLEAGLVDPADLPGCLDGIPGSGFRLVYAPVAWDDLARRQVLESRGARLVDRKTTFLKADLGPEAAWPVGIAASAATDPSPGLIALALASGHLSRFRVDPGIPEGVFEQLYGTWIRRSLDHDLADAVLVAAGEAGLVTLRLEGDQAVIGLIAVAADQRGKGLGRSLIQASFAWGRDRGASSLRVVTQGLNRGACALYLASGCRVVQEDAYYHVWVPGT